MCHRFSLTKQDNNFFCAFLTPFEASIIFWAVAIEAQAQA